MNTTIFDDDASMNDDDINADSPRRRYTINEFVYDREARKFWCLVDGATRSAQGVDSLIPFAAWPIDADGKRMRPSSWIRREAL